jgi:hypothetical protein
MFNFNLTSCGVPSTGVPLRTINWQTKDLAAPAAINTEYVDRLTVPIEDVVTAETLDRVQWTGDVDMGGTLTAYENGKELLAVPVGAAWTNTAGDKRLQWRVAPLGHERLMKTEKSS